MANSLAITYTLVNTIYFERAPKSAQRFLDKMRDKAKPRAKF
jgi:hypothetical protein